MCGVAAIFTYDRRAASVSRCELMRIREQMRGRGPDGAGVWLSDDERVGLAHRRLSIIDLAERAAQPMFDPRQRAAITYNGEIYNYRALRDELEACGHQFRTTSDTEVLLQLFCTHGESMLQRLRGMFAFALWDTVRGALWLARDGYGIKPLYYADDGRCVRVASQVKALLAGQRIPRTIDPVGVCGFLMLGSVPEPHSLYAAVRALPAGHACWIDEGGPVHPQAWFSVAEALRHAPAPSPPLAGSEQRLAALALMESAESHLEADVPVGLFLSAGVDSAALLGLIRSRRPTSQVMTVTLAFDEFRGRPDDEAAWAARIAQTYSADHREYRLGRDEFEGDMPAVLESMDQPSIDGANTWFVSKVAAHAGLKVAISGLGGDELFGGYPSFTQVPALGRLRLWPSSWPIVGAGLAGLHRGLLRAVPFGSPKLPGLLRYAGSMAGAYFLRRAVFMPWELAGIVGREVTEAASGFEPTAHLRESVGDFPLGQDFAHVAALESCVYMRNQLLRDADWAGMAHGVEIRAPLVDTFLLRRLAPLLCAGLAHKGLLANAPDPPLPSAVRERPKSGFVLPMREWLASSRRLDDWRRLSLLRRRNCHWSRRWAYTVLRRFLPDWEAMRSAA